VKKEGYIPYNSALLRGAVFVYCNGHAGPKVQDTLLVTKTMQYSLKLERSKEVLNLGADRNSQY